MLVFPAKGTFLLYGVILPFCSCGPETRPILQVFWYRTRLALGPAEEIQSDLMTASILKMWLSTYSR